MMCSNGLNPREGIITVLSPVPAWISNVDWFKWLKSSGGDYYVVTLAERDGAAAFKWLKSSGGDYYFFLLRTVVILISTVQMA